MINLDVGRIADPFIRKALLDLQNALNDIDFIQARYQMFEINIKGANTAFEVPHNLGFVPTDLVVTRASGSSYSFVWEKFTDQKIVINATGPVLIRIYMGRNNGAVPIGTN
jgi:hypothetical protein